MRSVTGNRRPRFTAARGLRLGRPLPGRSAVVGGYGVIYLIIAVLFVMPAVMVVYGAFRTSAPGRPGQWTLEAFVDAYTDPATYTLLKNSVLYAAAVTIIGMAVAIFFAWVVTQTDTPLRRFVTPIMVTLVGLPLLFFAISWQLLANSHTGLLNQLLRTFIPGDTGPINIRTWYGIVFVSMLKVAAINYMLMINVFRSLDPNLREASLIAGVSRFKTFFRIELPVLAPLLLSLTLLGFVSGLESFDIPILLGSPVGIQVFSTQIYTDLYTFPPGYGTAGALSIMLIVIMGILTTVMWRFLRKRDFTVVGGKGLRVEPMRIGAWRYVCSAAIVLFAALALVFPLVQLVLGSLQPTFGVMTSSLTLEHFHKILSEGSVLAALKNTALIAVVGGVIAVAFATLVAYVVQRGKSRARWGLEGATWLPWALPGVVLSLGMLWAYLSIPGLRGLYGTIWLVMIGLIVVATPISVRLANAAIGQVHEQLEESARVHGAGKLRAVTGVVVRLILPSLLSAWLLGGLAMAGNLPIPVLLSGPGSQTVPALVLQLIDSGDSSDAAAVFVLMLLGMAALLLVALLLRVVGSWLATSRTTRSAMIASQLDVPADDSSLEPPRAEVTAGRVGEEG